MICVTIGRGRHKMLLAEHAHVARMGAPLTELRLDYILRTIDLKRLTDGRPTETILTCRRPQDGGKWRGSESDRIVVLRSAIASGVDYVDLEEDIAGDIPRFGPTKRIVSYHNLNETPDDIESIHARMVAKDPDIIKIATYANSPGDNVRVLRLIENSPVPTVAFCMGELGTISRVLCLQRGAPFTYASLSSERAMAPGQFTYRELTESYNVSVINQDTEFLGVIADPVGHSLSPVIHNELLAKDKVNKIYLPIRVPREHLDEFMDSVMELRLTGLSVTIPHKESVLRFVNGLDEDVAGIRATNTLVIKNDSVYAYNTDCRAAMLSLAHREGKFEQKQPFAGRKALVLGSGGVAKALTYGLIRGGADVLIAGRNTRVAEQMSLDFKCKSIDWAARHDVDVDYLINCTPVGMHPDLNNSPYEAERIRSNTLVFDTVYTPAQTLLIKNAKEAGCEVITGVDMFVRQAALQYKLFTGLDPNVQEMRRAFLEAINPAAFRRKKAEANAKKEVEADAAVASAKDPTEK